MNDRYLYRAKRSDNGKWLEGNRIDDGVTGQVFIHSAGNTVNESDKVGEDGCLRFIAFEVDPSTICQCTGMPDKNSKVAYEHDIIKTPVGNAKIIWNCSPIPTDNHINVGFEVVFPDATANDNYRHDLGYWIGKSEVIRNIGDNPELLEVGE